MKTAEWLYADEFLVDGKWQQVKLTIKEVFPPQTFRGHDGKPMEEESISFQGTEKLFALNKTNTRLMRIVTGTGTRDNWIGRKIILYPVTGNYFGKKNCPALRIRTPEGAHVPFSVQSTLEKETDITGTSEVVASREEVEEAAAAARREESHGAA